MRIRRAERTEASALCALALRAKQLWGYAADDIERWRTLLVISADDITANPTFVAEIEAEVVGFYSLVLRSHPCELDHLWVSPTFARRGIGRALLAHATDSARLAGVSSIVIDADPNAEPFYIACGAIRTGIVAAPIVGDPARVRPQLSLRVTLRGAPFYLSRYAAHHPIEQRSTEWTLAFRVPLSATARATLTSSAENGRFGIA